MVQNNNKKRILNELLELYTVKKYNNNRRYPNTCDIIDTIDKPFCYFIFQSNYGNL